MDTSSETAEGGTAPRNGLHDRAQGCLLGQLTGDALGSMVEFEPAFSIRERYPGGLRHIGPSPVWNTLPGQPTDDSELALMLARTLERTGGFDDEQIAAAYGSWRKSHPFDIGNAMRRATDAIIAAEVRGQSRSEAARAAASRGSEANGALMRQSPLAVWGHALPPEELDDYVRRDTTLTHPSQVCQDASADLMVTLAGAIREGLDAQTVYARACEWDRRHGGSPTVTQALADARRAEPDYEYNEGHVLIAIQNAFYQVLHSDSFEEGVVATVMGGGDTDTNAAIAGALLGAIHGLRSIPAQWREAVLSCCPAAGAAGVHRPRPRDCWPVDALELAKHLVQGRQ